VIPLEMLIEDKEMHISHKDEGMSDNASGNFSEVNDLQPKKLNEPIL